MKEPIVTANIGGTISTKESNGSGDAIFIPTQGNSFATVKITGCEAEVVIHVQGSQLCSIAKMEEELTLPTITCNATGGKLKNGTKEVTFNGKFDLSLNLEDDAAILLQLF